MKSILGDYKEDAEGRLRDFSVDISSDNVDLRWSQCSLLADFLADYYESSFPEAPSGGLVDRNDMRHSINYIMNELVENAIKFRDSGDLSISAGLVEDEMIFLVRNRIASGSVAAFQALLREITDGNPGDLLIQKIEKNASDPGNKVSGLGFLTMMSDYGAKMGWMFEDCEDGGDNVNLSVMTRLKIRKDD